MPKETKQVQQEEIEKLEDLSEEEQQTIGDQEKAVPAEETPAKEEAKSKRKKKDDEIVEERFYTIPLQKALVRPPKKRAPRAMQLVKLFVTKHMKIDMKVSEEEELDELPQLVISKEVNEKIWAKGIEKPPRKIKTRVTKDRDGNVIVYLAENS